MSNTRGWVKWCFEHRLSWIVTFVAYIMLPLYLLAYWSDAVSDWNKDLKYIKDWRTK